MTHQPEPYGCPACLPPNPADAWEAVRSMRLETELVEQSHFMVKIRACRSCGQRFVSAFTETIDWADGEDPQFWSVLPITAEEAEQLQQAGRELLARLDALAPERRSLCRDYPKGAGATAYWCHGLQIGPHD